MIIFFLFCFFIFSKVFFCNYILIVIKLYSLWPEDFQIFFPTVKHDLMIMGHRERGREEGGGREEQGREQRGGGEGRRGGGLAGRQVSERH